MDVAPDRRRVQYVEMTCLFCKQTFDCRPSWVKDGRRKFCQKTCLSAWLKTQTGALSPHYGKSHTQSAKQKMSNALHLRNLHRQQVGEKHPSWKGGEFFHQGYRYVLIANLSPEDQALARAMVPNDHYVREHRLVMARLLGRPLKKSETVHHINGVKDDNKPENLELLGTAAHSRQHRDMVRELGKLRQENERLKSLLMTCRCNGNSISRAPAAI